MEYNQQFNISNNKISANNIDMNIICDNWNINIFENLQYENDIYYSYDAKDGRESVGRFAKGVSYTYSFNNNNKAYLQFTLTNEKKYTEILFDNEIQRQKDLIEKCGLKDEIAKVLVRATDQFICKRESTDSLTIIAGYPFFADWGRDTMYALEGCCITTKRYEDAKNIFRTFIKYLKNGIMPNLFPEGENEPLYNTVDASLLFIQSVYSYYKATKDLDFIKEAYEPMVSVLENYIQGTEYDIKMDTDYLIKAGSGFNQLTWMDVRYEEELPTPRHGKPVEINAFWYSSLKIINEFGKLLNKDTKKY